MKTLAIALLALVMSASAQTFSTLYTFSGSSGSSPSGKLTLDAQGNLYGTTNNPGGSGPGYGTVFELTPNNGTWAEAVLYSFSGKADGNHPNGGLLLDASGNLYGTTMFGGSSKCNSGCGVVFKLSPGQSGWTQTVIHSFQGKDGSMPSAGLVVGASGNLYGATLEGGATTKCQGAGCGVVFELSPNAGKWTFRDLIDLGNITMNTVTAPLTLDAQGDIYEATDTGVFRLSLVNGKWTHTILRRFTPTKDPMESTMFNPNGALYGTCGLQGAIYELIPGIPKWTYTVLYKTEFEPASGVITDAAGNLYGTATGGPSSYGMIYSLAANTWAFTDLYDFPSTNPNPYGDLVMDGSGNLYGVTSGDGSTTFGSVWELTP